MEVVPRLLIIGGFNLLQVVSVIITRTHVSYLVQHKPSKDTPETTDIRPKTGAVLDIDCICSLKKTSGGCMVLVPKRMLYSTSLTPQLSSTLHTSLCLMDRGL